MVKDINSTEWLLLAASKDPAREKLMNVYSNIATDGMRIHFDTNLPAIEKDKMPFNISDIIDPVYKYEHFIEINTTEIIRIMKTLKACNLVILTVNKSELLLTSKITGYSKTSIEIKMPLVQKTDLEFEIGLNPIYLLEAVMGFISKKSIMLYVSTDGPSKHPVYIRASISDIRQAIIMPMHIGGK